MLTNEEIFAKDKSDYLPVFARYNIVLDHGDVHMFMIQKVKNISIF